MLKWVFPVVFLLFAFQAQARKVAYFWGGGGEPKNQAHTLFDGDLTAWGPLLIQAGYEIRMAFGTGHVHSEKLAKKIVGTGNNEEFTVTTLRDHLADLQKQIEDKKLVKGDKLIFVITSHGWNPLKGPELSSHRVDIFQGKNKESSFSLDEIQPALKLAEENGLKAAVFDFSCYSGATLSLSSARTCVVASSAAEEASYSDFSKRLAEKMAPGKNLEQAFIEARKWTTDYSGPEISTFANYLVRSQIHQKVGHGAPHERSVPCVSCNRIAKLLKDVFGISQLEPTGLFIENDVANQIRNMANIRASLNRAWPSVEALRDYKYQAVPAYYAAERKYYETLYRQIRSENRPNPCAGFDF